MVTKTIPWNSELLRDKEDIAAYLDAAFEEAFELNDVSAFTRALEAVANLRELKGSPRRPDSGGKASTNLLP